MGAQSPSYFAIRLRLKAKQRNLLTMDVDDLSQAAYGDMALQTFELIEEFSQALFPCLWPGLTTMKQAQITSLVFARQMLGKSVTVAQLTQELGYPRSSVQHTIDTLIDRGRMITITDPDDARRKLIRLPRDMGSEAGEIELLLVKFRLRWHDRMKAVLERHSELSG